MERSPRPAGSRASRSGGAGNLIGPADPRAGHRPPGSPESAQSRFFRPGGIGLPTWVHQWLLVAALLAGVIVFPLLAHAAPATGTAAPDFALKDLAGANQRLSEFRGDVVVLTFWASWCGPCRETLADVERLAVEAGGERPVVIGVNLDGDAARAASVASALGIASFTLVDHDQRVGRLYDVAKLPLTLLLDRDGVVRGAWSRERIPSAELTAGIRELLRQ